MKLLVCILIVIPFVSCGQKSNELTRINSNANGLDTLFAGSYILSFENADSFPKTDIYGDFDYRTKLTDTIGNWHERALQIQSYQLGRFGDKFYLTDSMVVLKLSNGNTLSFPNWDNENDEGYTFEHYFDNIDYYLLRVQRGEGNGWMLVNRKNGIKNYINGLPYISNNNKSILTINADLEAGYSFNGLELYSILNDSLQIEFSLETVWGPTDVKWINENQFLLKREHYQVDGLRERQDYFIDFKQVTILKKTR